MKNVRCCLPASLWGALATAAALGNHAGGQPAGAPIVFDGSLGKPAGDLSGDTIFADRGVQAGANLFHSFSRFNVGKGKTATFQVPANTGNVLARVTGRSASQIDGKIRTDARVNLYLMNPQGVLFGNGASVDVAGSFTATTADYISFKDQNGGESRFWASADGATTLVSDPPAKFGFLDSGTSGRIEISLSDSDGQIDNDGAFASGAFTAVGREIVVRDSFILYDGGDLGFLSVGSGEIGVAGQTASQTGLAASGGITFTNSAFDSAAGRAFQARAGGDLILDRTAIASADGLQGSSKGGILLSSGGDLTLQGASVQKLNFGPGESGNVLIESGKNLRITESGSISSFVGASGGGADLSLKAVGRIDLDQFGLISSVSGAGQGGAINVEAGEDFEISGFGLIQSAAMGQGRGGAIQIQAGGLSIKGESEKQPQGRTTGIQSLTESPGAGGDISVKVDREILLRDTGGIYASANAGGRSGSINIKSDILRIIGARNYSAAEQSIRPDNFFITGISIKNARNELTGSLGSIDVDVKNDITLELGGLIDATSFSLNPASSAGDVTVRAGGIRADRMGSDYFTGIGSGTVADENSGNTNSGRGGVVLVEAPLIGLFGGAQIAASSRSGGDAGSIVVRTNQLTASGRGSVTDFLFTGESGIVAATRGLATGGAGDVTVLGIPGFGMSGLPSLVLSNGAEVSARAEGTGGGGSVNIDFSGGNVILDSGAAISARSGELGGNAGSVVVRAADIVVGKGASISSTNGAGPAIGGDAGSVTLVPGNLRVDGGRLEVSSAGGNAGSVSILGGELLDFRHAEVVAEAYLDGGNISMQGASFLLLDQSLISANAERGNGGNILLNAGVILNNGSQITASSRFGVDGIVRIVPQSALSGAEEQEDVDPLNVTDSLQPECTNRLATAAGSFIRAGRGGTSRLPGGYLPSLRLHRTH